MSNHDANKLEVRCVLKTGGPYNAEYVKILMNAVKANSTIPYTFVCLTDDPGVDFCETIPLQFGWPGWWSKIELFRKDLPKVQSVFFDLDTVIMGNIDAFLHVGLRFSFIALRGFNHRFRKPESQNFASGIMAGSFYEYSFVFTAFKLKPQENIDAPRENWMHGDQGFIADTIGLDEIPRLQDKLPEDYIIGKKYLKDNNNKFSPKTKIIAWSGSPRLHELKSESPIKQHWRKHV